MRKVASLFLLGFVTSVLRAQTLPSAVTADPLPDPAHPASFTQLAIPSHGERLLGVLLLAAGTGPHPTVVLLHGFPGYEQNLDLAQAMRRAGWNVVAVHYRGSWGVGGDFSLAHAMEDADAMVDFVISPEAVARYQIDPRRIAVVGHSMGGYMAASATAHHPAVLGAAMIGTWDITAPARSAPHLSAQDLTKRLEQSRMETEAADFYPLHNYTGHQLAAEIATHAQTWDLLQLVPTLTPRPILLLTANDGSQPGSERLLAALKAAGDRHASLVFTPTDHPFSGARLHLEALVLNWLAELPAASALQDH